MVESKRYQSVPFIQGKNINLCPPNTEHLNLYTTWMNNPNIRKYARYDMPTIPGDIKSWFEPKQENIKSEIFLEVWHIDDEKPIGYAGFINIRWFDKSAFLFYIIGECDYWGKGFATEAAKLVVEYGFNELNLHKINAIVFAPNISSVRVVEKNGFKLELTLTNEMYVDGKYVDALRYSLLKKEWEILQGEK
ncbi:MAG: GNAT family N-acetyltransferase [Promethearchaeota archaeon]